MLVIFDLLLSELIITVAFGSITGKLLCKFRRKKMVSTMIKVVLLVILKHFILNATQQIFII